MEWRCFHCDEVFTNRKHAADHFQIECGDDFNGLIQRIIAEPHNNSHRWLFADTLDRTAGEIECQACKRPEWAKNWVDGCHHVPGTGWVPCVHCRGTCRVPDGRKEWAEFIRVQIEIATQHDLKHRPPASEANNRLQDELLRRERELWPVVKKWFAGADIEPYYAAGLGVTWTGDNRFSRSVISMRVQRGLPCLVRCLAEKWTGGACENCEGLGEFRRLHGYEGPEGPCLECGGKWNSGPHTDSDSYWDKGAGRILGIGPRLVHRWPIVEVLTLDKRPQLAGDLWWFRDQRENNSHWADSCRLPNELSKAMGGHRTEAAARTSLSATMLEWAQRQPVELSL